MLHVANAQDAPRNRETYATPSHHVPINIVSALTEPPSPRLQHGKWKDLAADFRFGSSGHKTRTQYPRGFLSSRS